MKRYDFDELTKHECDDGEWVKASEAEAEIAALKKRIAELEKIVTQVCDSGEYCKQCWACTRDRWLPSKKWETK